MPRDFLLKLEHVPLPRLVTDVHELDCVHVLKAAELIEADVQPGPAGASVGETAMITRITPMGRAEIERIKRGA